MDNIIHQFEFLTEREDEKLLIPNKADIASVSVRRQDSLPFKSVLFLVFTLQWVKKEIVKTK